MSRFNKSLIFVLIIFHSIGLIGMLCFNQKEFVQLSWLNLVVSTIISFLSYKKKMIKYTLPFIIVVLFSFFIEVVGVNTGLLFGDYFYGETLGLKVFNTPLLIGFLWLTLSLGAKSIVLRLPKLPKQIIYILSALLMVGIDFLIEPVAIKLGYWQWSSGVIPLYNYLCWFVFAYVNQLFLKKVNNRNIVLEVLFVINVLFFILLNNLL